MKHAIKQTLLMLFAIYIPLIALVAVVLRDWVQNPGMTEMQVFLKWWHVILLGSGASIYSAWLWARGERHE